MLDKSPGTYILLMTLARPRSVEIGRLGVRRFEAGLFAYVGSARGPGGLAARLGRHFAGTGPKRWHLDWLRPHVEVVGALVREGRERVECAWAAWVAERAAGCVVGFGSSDCRCPGHLFRVGGFRAVGRFREAAEAELGAEFEGEF
ncbi:MAG: GIY-YIG nuclease family protein [Planctomycetota bacterium]